MFVFQQQQIPGCEIYLSPPVASAAGQSKGGNSDVVGLLFVIAPIVTETLCLVFVLCKTCLERPLKIRQNKCLKDK